MSDITAIIVSLYLLDHSTVNSIDELVGFWGFALSLWIGSFKLVRFVAEWMFPNRRPKWMKKFLPPGKSVA
jgi:hypothetical protein